MFRDKSQHRSSRKEPYVEDVLPFQTTEVNLKIMEAELPRRHPCIDKFDVRQRSGGQVLVWLHFRERYGQAEKQAVIRHLTEFNRRPSSRAS
jgi:hypothetical protein